MGDSTDANMETDVSSTTADVPDAHEVSGSSQGDVETMIIIEQVEEVKQAQKDNESVDVVTRDNKSPKKNHTSQIEISPSKSNSPQKVIIISKPQSYSPQKPTTPEPAIIPFTEMSSITTPFKELESTPMEEGNPISKSPIKHVAILDITPSIDSNNISKIQQSETVDSSNNVGRQPSLNNEANAKLLQATDSTIETEIPEKDYPNKKIFIKEVDLEISIEASVSNISQEKLNDIDSVDSTDSSKQEVIVDKNICKTPIPIEFNPEKEVSNDSQLETNSDMSEKDRKSISRELKSLIKSAKESKIINEYTQVTSKMRKSRSALDSSNSSLNTSVELEKIGAQRRSSINSQKSNSSEKSEKVMKRSMRSQNPEFVNKVKQFLNSVTGKVHKNDTETGNQLDDELKVKQKDNQSSTSPSSPKKKMLKQSEDLISEKPGKLKSDPYCWRCHWGVDQDSNDKTHPPMYCTVCPRSFHYKCFTGPERNKLGSEDNWVCPECKSILQAENSDSRSPAMKRLSLGVLCELLNYALERMMDINGVEPFTHAVDRTAFPEYEKYVIHPMDLSIMKENIKNGCYGSTEAFHADAQWILHNSVIFNTMQSKLTGAARQLLRSCRSEMGEIEACPECYLAAHARKPTWFVDVCSTPHILLWAKLKGFPYWPAKGMSFNNSGLVDVRFFGAHDRAWVPAKDCFLYSEKDPNNFRTKRQDIIDSMQEAEQHIRNISRKYGKFVYPPFKTPFEINKMTEQIRLMIPSFEGEFSAPVRDKSFAASPQTSKSNKTKGSKSEGDTSVLEESNPTLSSPAKSSNTESTKQTTKTQDFAVASEPMEVEKIVLNKPEPRKRRRSELEEAVITVLESAPKEKRQKIDAAETTEDNNKQDKPAAPKTDKSAEPKADKPIEPKTDPPQVEEEKPKEVEQKTPKIKSNATSKNNTPTFVSKTPKINPLKIVLTPKSKTPKTPKSTDKSAKKSDKADDINKSRSSTPKSHKKKPKSTEIKVVSAPDKPEKPASKNMEIIPVKVTSSKPTSQIDTENRSLLRQDSKGSPSQKTKDRITFDDDTSLAVIARETSKSKSQNLITNNTGLPTITSVRSLSDTVAITSKTNKSTSKSAESLSSNDNAKIAKETNRVQRVRNNGSSLVGKVGVRAFARMTSPSIEVPITNNVQVEIKSEPIDLDDADRQVEKMDLMNHFQLRPVNRVNKVSVPTSNLRDVRINKVVITPPNARKSTSKLPDGKPKARKSFPQSKKDDGRSELNSKNSMVYIPIQPPNTQAPVRPMRPMHNGPVTSTSTIRTSNTAVSTGNNLVNTVTTPLIPNSIGTIPVTTASIVPPTFVPASQGISQMSGNMNLPSMPVLATMNGQWTLMPIMSVGGVDNASSPTLVNGIPDRSAPPQSIMPLIGNTTSLNATLTPANQMRPTEAMGELPRLQQRPLINPLDGSSQPDEVPTPSTAGPITRNLNQNAAKLSDFFRNLLEDSILKIDDPAAQLTAAKLQLEETNWKHKHEIEELIHSNNLVVTEMRLSFEKEKTRAVNEIKKTMQAEIETTMKQIKRKQWCANCLQEAQFYCCWNTSYCNYSCQREHWPTHLSVCTQQKSKNRNSKEVSSEPESRLQPQPDFTGPIITKVSSASTVTVGGKVVTPSPDKNPKPAVIMSMVQDPSGNQSVKYVGTFKDPTYKQIINNEEPQTQSTQTVLSSGGYLIVGTTDPSALGAQNHNVRKNFST